MSAYDDVRSKTHYLVLEGLSDEVGAGLGIQEAMQHQAKTAPAPLGPLLVETLKKSLLIV